MILSILFLILIVNYDKLHRTCLQSRKDERSDTYRNGEERLIINLAVTVMVSIDDTPELVKQDEVNDVENYNAHVDACDICSPRLDPPGELLLAAVGVLVAGNQVPALDGHRLPVVDEILNTIGAAAAHLDLCNNLY